MSDYQVGFIGFGHMAQVIFHGMDQAKLIPRSQIRFIRRDTHKMRENEREFGITSASLKTLIETSHILILGVRPNQGSQVLEELKRLELDPSKPIISVLAGVKHPFYRKFLKNPILRAMPNIASEVGMGMTIFNYSENASREFQSASHLLFSCMGEIIEMPEELMDISTAIAGCGPGFVFRLIQAVAKEGEKKGIPHSDALKMAAQTFMGAAKLVMKKKEPERLLEQIATPNGVTEAGLKKMSELKIDEQIQSVIAASTKRSKELSEE